MLYKVKDAAKALHLSCSSVRRLIEDGTLIGKKLCEGGPIMVESSTMADYVLAHMDIYADEILECLECQRETEPKPERTEAAEAI